MGGEEEFFDDQDRSVEQEGHADRITNRVLLRHVRTVVLRLVVVLPALAAGTVGIRVLTVMSLWHLSGTPLFAVVALLIVDLAWGATVLARHLRGSRPLAPTRSRGRRSVGDSSGALDMGDVAGAGLGRSRRWCDRIGSASWWFEIVATACYLLVAAVMLAHWTTPLVAVVAGVATATVLSVGGDLLDRWRPELTSLSAFVTEIRHDRHDHECDGGGDDGGDDGGGGGRGHGIRE